MQASDVYVAYMTGILCVYKTEKTPQDQKSARVRERER